ncbi:hypothetical protein [Hydrogenovibrio marinus]|uniref:Uncharacterized protein n=1 Tax=Hydrogenovibrio marinus TaxID=28885 RepID=A0A066ZLN8_HYDMR|nr:hypothetical protein [Hydrogenovibrio marinus]KDN94708.1 hypothetical protein EI16_12490 [Hydrogenovibrio marinus]
MPEDIHTANSREMYVALRKSTGCPPVQHTKLSEYLHVLNIKDTDFEITFDGQSFGNVWEMKSEVLIRYRQHLADLPEKEQKKVFKNTEGERFALTKENGQCHLTTNYLMKDVKAKIWPSPMHHKTDST